MQSRRTGHHQFRGRMNGEKRQRASPDNDALVCGGLSRHRCARTGLCIFPFGPPGQVRALAPSRLHHRQCSVARPGTAARRGADQARGRNAGSRHQQAIRGRQDCLGRSNSQMPMGNGERRASVYGAGGYRSDYAAAELYIYCWASLVHA
jgi:hypothetical protein